MIIKFIPENDAERATLKEEEHYGVTEFFVFGQKKEGDGQVVDFHSWRGNHRYLLGSMNYFYEVVNDERRTRAMSAMSFPPSGAKTFNLHRDDVDVVEPVKPVKPVEPVEPVNEEQPMEAPEVIQMPEPGFDLDKKE